MALSWEVRNKAAPAVADMPELLRVYGRGKGVLKAVRQTNATTQPEAVNATEPQLRAELR
jgi:hypothetical protein